MASKAKLTGKHQYAEFKDETVQARIKDMVDMRESIDITDRHIKLSYGNRKTTALVPSVSLIPGADCRNCSLCIKGCYAIRSVCCYKQSRAMLANNSAIAHQDLPRFFKEIDASVKFLRYFRYNASGGDILHPAFLTGMVDVAIKNPHCLFLAFSKADGIINDYLDDHTEGFPNNLRIILSGWRGDKNVNRHNLPVSSPIWPDGSKSCMCTENVYMCPGNCSECAEAREGCWSAKKGDTILFEAH